ncbi:hypothetical protein CPB86DRAFT_730221 [Serendipita vermifera]|nr:hypothetical protein CPB86DRAFT_730221 [Serendipita vermifera]
MYTRISSVLFLLSLLPALALAQFGFFDQMFQGQHHHQQQRAGSNNWMTMADSTPCPKYLCPGTLICANQPIDCPCPYPEDIKCVIPDKDINGKVDNQSGGTVVCVRGNDGCDAVNKML